MAKLIASILKPILNIFVSFTVKLLDFVYDYSYRRFFTLEVIARIPYFSYLSVLHISQTLGWHPKLEQRDLHDKETMNEQYHLLIAEDLGGGKNWYDRFAAKFLGVFYYWIAAFLYFVSPASGYYLMELIEGHAAHSYSTFLKMKGEELKKIEATGIALEYYYSNNARMTKAPAKSDKVSLYDIFESIKMDEMTHISDMKFYKEKSLI